MRKELDSSLDQMTATNELMQKRVDEKTGALEEQATEVAAFLSRAEKQIGEKVSNDELTRVTKAFAEQLQHKQRRKAARATNPNTPLLAIASPRRRVNRVATFAATVLRPAEWLLEMAALCSFDSVWQCCMQ